MTIQNRLTFVAGGVIGTVVVLLVIYLFSYQQISKEIQEAETLTDFANELVELNLLTAEYLTYKEPRTYRQWQAQYQDIQAQLEPVDSLLDLHIIRSTFRSLGTTFTMLDSVIRQQNRQSKASTRIQGNNLREQLVSRISSHLRIETQKLITLAITEAQTARQEVQHLHQRNQWILILLSISLIGGLGYSMYRNIRNIIQPLRNLEDKASRIELGDFETQIDIEGPPEITRVGRSLNAMRQRLVDLLRENENKVEALRRAKNRIQAQIENSPLAIIEWDAEFRVAQWTGQAEAFFGWNEAEVLGKNPEEWQFVHEKDAAEVDRIMNKLLSGENARNISTNRNYTKSSDVITCQWYNSAIYDNQGQLLSIYSIVDDITDRKEMESQLRRNLNLFSSLINNVPGGVIVEDDDHMITHVNQQFCNLTGFESPDAVIGRKGGEAFREVDDLFEEPEKFYHGIQERIQKKERVTSEEIRLTDGRILERDYVPISLGDGQNENLWLYRDITERKQAEARLKESEARFRQIAENIEEVFYITDPDKNKMLYISPGYEEVWDRPVDELYEKATAFLLYIHPEDRERVQDRLPLQKTGEFDETYRIIRPDNSIRWVRDQAYPIENEDGEVYRVVGVAQDITDLIETQQALRKSEALFRGIVENMEEGFYRTTPAGEIRMVNPQFAHMLGYDVPDKFEGQFISELDHFREYPRDEFIDTILNHGVVRNFQSTWIHRDGHEITVKENAHAVKNDQGNVLYYEGTVEDITEQKKLEQQLIQSQKVESLGQVAGGIAHDFNNVLATISGAIQMIQVQIDEGDIAHYFDMAFTAMDRGETVTDRLLTFTRSGTPQVEPVALQALLYDIQKMAEYTLPASVDVTVEKYAANDLVLAERTQLQQVLINMCINAAHAMEEQGTVTLGIRDATPEEYQTHKPETDSPYLCIEVTDTGAGMDRKTQERIFEPFFTTKEHGQGTGLGLAVAQKIITNHDGWIDVESAVGKGTTFVIGLPMTEDTVESEVPEQPIMEYTANGEQIYLIEDESPLRALLQETLESVGYTVTTAKNGQEGIERFETLESPVSLLITDLGLPDMSGEQVAATIREDYPDLPLIAITGYVDAEKDRSLKDQGFQAVLKKPFDLQEVLHTIQAVIESETP
ncbi:MAG: PAS domain S-box protein [Candidatus Marinimicrobia bacterium]|nr:PAS domain S-box protein [Candidatus Neomarinimicrobiota bacterium]MCF7830326.1 PAS domain S-box protein [Candidatus Neomarinimicrobiota bacterium]MCF7882303.1 PAS domain S-box protein [Candidatus Neomarinimicrobiota bacterium]